MSFFTLISNGISAAAAETTHGESAAGSLPQLDMSWWPSQIFWLGLTFIVLYFFMARHFLPAIGGAIEERKNRIADDLDKASELKSQARDAEEDYNTALADAKARAQAIAAQTRSEIDAEIAALQAETDAALATKVDAAEERIMQMSAAAGEKVRGAARETARAVVETLIDETPSDDVIASAITATAKP